MRFVRLIAFTLLPSLSVWAALNDTGQSQCYDGTSLVPCTASNSGDAASYPRQDGRFGRDAAASAGTLTKTGGGAAGFDFTKLGVDGNALAIQDQAWSYDGSGYDNGSEGAGTRWSCVRDNVTGLVWEVKTHATPADLRDSGWTYTWYHSDEASNGGNAGTPAPASGICNGGTSRCDTEKYIADVNALNICGETADDWRLPTRDQLQSIVHFGIQNPAIDSSYFPNTINSVYWSDSSYAKNSSLGLVVDFYGGFDDFYGKDSSNSVRLVRGRP